MENATKKYQLELRKHANLEMEIERYSTFIPNIKVEKRVFNFCAVEIEARKEIKILSTIL